MSDKTQTLLRNEPSQFELNHNLTMTDSALRAFTNEDGEESVFVSVYMHYIHLWHRRVRRILDFALEDLLVRELKRSRSAEPPNRVEKMTLKNLYRDRNLQRLNRMHASLNNNLVKKVKTEIDDYVQSLNEQGLILRRIPTIDILPVDKEY